MYRFKGSRSLSNGVDVYRFKGSRSLSYVSLSDVKDTVHIGNSKYIL